MVIPFFQYLHRGGAYAYYHALPERRSYWYPTSRPLAPPAECSSNWYISVHPSKEIPPCNAHGEIKAPPFVRAQKAFIASLAALYAEFDIKAYGSKEAIRTHLDEQPIAAPSVLIGSGGGLHAYWLLHEPFTLDQYDMAFIDADPAADNPQHLALPPLVAYKLRAHGPEHDCDR